MNTWGAATPHSVYGTYAYHPPTRFQSLTFSGWAAGAGIVLYALANLSYLIASNVIDPEHLEGDVVGALAIAVTAFGQLIAFALAAVFFLLWTHTAASNLRAFGREHLQYTAGWSVGWWFIPFANLVKPMQAMSEIWRQSEHHDPSAWQDWWNVRANSNRIGAWWAAWLVSRVVNALAARFHEPILAVIASAIMLTAVGLALGLILALSRRQRDTARALGLA